MIYDIYRGSDVFLSVKPTGKQSKKIMDVNVVQTTFTLPYYADLLIGDSIQVFGERYSLQELPEVKEVSRIQFDYTCTFKGKAYDLAKIGYLFYDNKGDITKGDFSVMGNAEVFIRLLIANAKRIDSNWEMGTIDVTDYENISFSNDNCLSVLATLATTFNLEWWVDGYTINMTKIGTVQDFTLAYGKGNGLYDITRSNSSDANVITRLYAFGGTQNIPGDYRNYSTNLRLPSPLIYLEKNTDLFGIIEHTETFDDIYPHRTGIVTAVSDPYTFTDSDIDFDVNDQLLPGVTAQIVFNTGQLAGYTFDVNSFNNATKTFTINKNTDEKAIDVPSDLLKPEIGDQYVLISVNMPQSYIDNAELSLKAAAQDYLDKYSLPVLEFTVTCDPINFKQRELTIGLGDYIPVESDEFDVHRPIRVTSFDRDIQDVYNYSSLGLAEIIQVAPIVRSYVAAEKRAIVLETVATASSAAYATALRAKATSDGIKAITDFWGVTIDSAHGIVAAGTLLVGDGAINSAGITGVTDQEDSVRFWAGKPYEDRYTAPFRVLESGKLFATDAVIEGTISAKSGSIGNWDITDQGLENINSANAFIHQNINYGSGMGSSDILLGVRNNPVDQGTILATIQNNKNGDDTNIALALTASGAKKQNYALVLDGGLFVDNPSSGGATNAVVLSNIPSTGTLDGYYHLVWNINRHTVEIITTKGV